MIRYFKLVALRDPSLWLFDEFRAARVRFGWSWPGTDLREIRKKPLLDRTDRERISWRYTKFLLEKLKAGDRLVLQFEKPMRKFLIAEVAERGYDFASPPQDEFNHIVHCRPLTDDFIPISAKCVPSYLRHDLTKRGHYYEIYPADSVTQLDRIVNEQIGRASCRERG